MELAAVVALVVFSGFLASYDDFVATGKAISSGEALPDWAGVPWNVFTNEPVITITHDPVEITSGTTRIVIEAKGEYLRKDFYFFNRNAGRWDAYTFDAGEGGEVVSNSEWLKGAGRKELAVDSALISQKNYIAAATCHRNLAGELKCGCFDANTCQRWQLQSFVAQDEADDKRLSIDEAKVLMQNVLYAPDAEKPAKIEEVRNIAIAISSEAADEPRADFNSDGAIDFKDFVILAENFGKSEETEDNFMTRQFATRVGYSADLTYNDKVEFDDFVIFARNFGKRTVYRISYENYTKIISEFVNSPARRTSIYAQYPRSSYVTSKIAFNSKSDLNLDGLVDFSDIQVFLDNSNHQNSKFDINGDLNVNDNDRISIETNLGRWTDARMDNKIVTGEGVVVVVSEGNKTINVKLGLNLYDIAIPWNLSSETAAVVVQYPSGEIKFYYMNIGETARIDESLYINLNEIFMASTGKFTYNHYRIIISRQYIPQKIGNDKCSDSDGSSNFYIAGISGVPSLTNPSGSDMVADKCFGNYLREGFCHDNKGFVSTDIFCRLGCNDGACRAELSDKIEFRNAAYKLSSIPGGDVFNVEILNKANSVINISKYNLYIRGNGEGFFGMDDMPALRSGQSVIYSTRGGFNAPLFVQKHCSDVIVIGLVDKDDYTIDSAQVMQNIYLQCN